jgi:hypothetical protein
MLGGKYEVKNFGHNGATLLRKGHNPYYKTKEFKEAIQFIPDIAIIHLGLNVQLLKKLFNPENKSLLILPIQKN